jgi:hypothetical protein
MKSLLNKKDLEKTLHPVYYAKKITQKQLEESNEQTKQS